MTGFSWPNIDKRFDSSPNQVLGEVKNSLSVEPQKRVGLGYTQLHRSARLTENYIMVGTLFVEVR